MSGVFISYRRDDAGGHAGWLRSGLAERLGAERVFMDIGTVEPGLDFVEVIEQAIEQCNVLLVVIGPNWLSSADPDGRRRLDDPEDNHRREIEAALRRRIRVIPVLVSQAAMPAMHELPESLTTLARRQSFELDTGRWEFDVSRLSAILEKDVGTAGSQAAAESESASATVPEPAATGSRPTDDGEAGPARPPGAPESDAESVPSTAPGPATRASRPRTPPWWKKPPALIAGALAAVLAFAALLAVALAPDGEPRRPSKAEYIARADNVCRGSRAELRGPLQRLLDFSKEAERAGRRGQTQSQILSRFADLVAVVEVEYRDALDKLSAIPRPAGRAGTGATDWINLLARNQRSFATVRTAAERGDAATVARLGGEMQAGGQRATKAATAYGFKVCGTEDSI